MEGGLLNKKTKRPIKKPEAKVEVKPLPEVKTESAFYKDEIVDVNEVEAKVGK